MTTSEDKIIAALQRLDAEADEVDSLRGVLADMTRAQSLWLRAFPVICIVSFLGLAAFSIVRFFTAEDVQSWIAYATLFVTSLIVIAIVKLWLYLVWVRNSLMREIKRTELRGLVGGRASTA